jgi:predicted SnoaL-like aldol condensation-catalyzing enzyme
LQSGRIRSERGLKAAERYWSPHYIQHRAGSRRPLQPRSEPPANLEVRARRHRGGWGLVIVHGRFSGFGASAHWIAADITHIDDGVRLEHWDVIQDEATQEQSKSGRPMFGNSFPTCQRKE